MCDFGISEGISAGIVAAIVSAVATAASTTMGVIASQQQARAAQAQMDYQAQVNKKNAMIAQQNAEDKRQEGIEESRMTRLKTAQKIGLQQSALAANGVDVSEGTALDIIEDTSAMGELDALTTRYNYEKQALAYEQQAGNFENQANLDIIAGQNARSAGTLNSISAGINGLGNMASVASKWYGGNSLGKK